MNIGKKTGGNFRVDIQALRAIAIGLVLINHLFPTRLTGGYVGVDVFFVISGFLITSHLWKELEASNSLRIGRFYARRVRRLLPAAFLVLIVSLLGTMVWLPFSRWVETAQQVFASAAYFENWVLAANSVDYSASTSSATVAQHYWSLSVEEQFYLLWPLLLWGLFLLAKRFWPERIRPVVVGLLAVLVASLLCSVLVTEFSKPQAYFVTPARAWEFAAGALVFFLCRRLKLGRELALVAALLGYLSIAFSALWFNTSTAFPGYLALIPVTGTALVIFSGSFGYRLITDRVFAWAPIQYLGNISYSLYLWHWPLIVLAPFVIGVPLGGLGKLVLAAIAILLAALSKVLVEDPGQRIGWLGVKSWRTFVAMVCGLCLIAGLSLWQTSSANQRADAAAAVIAGQEGQPCYGPRALEPGAKCTDAFGPAKVLTMSKVNQYWNLPAQCSQPLDDLQAAGTKTHVRCDFSQGDSTAKRVWAVGDSHGQQWESGLFEVAKKQHWIVDIAMLGGCPVADVKFLGFEGSKDPGLAARCTNWRDSVISAVSAARPAAVFTSMFAREMVVDGGPLSSDQALKEGLIRTWKAWGQLGIKVFVLADPPLNKGVRPNDCTLLNPSNPLDCAVPRPIAQPADPMAQAASSAADPNIRLIDLTDYFCDQRSCYAVIGGVVVYYDVNHLNAEYSKLLGPFIEQRVGTL